MFHQVASTGGRAWPQPPLPHHPHPARGRGRQVPRSLPSSFSSHTDPQAACLCARVKDGGFETPAGLAGRLRPHPQPAVSIFKQQGMCFVQNNGRLSCELCAAGDCSPAGATRRRLPWPCSSPSQLGAASYLPFPGVWALHGAWAGRDSFYFSFIPSISGVVTGFLRKSFLQGRPGQPRHKPPCSSLRTVSCLVTACTHLGTQRA